MENINQLRRLIYEIEGLLLLVEDKGSDAPNLIWEIIKEKLGTASNILDSNTSSQPEAEDVFNIETESKIEDDTEADIDDKIYTEDEINISVVQIDQTDKSQSPEFIDNRVEVTPQAIEENDVPIDEFVYSEIEEENNVINSEDYIDEVYIESADDDIEFEDIDDTQFLDDDTFNQSVTLDEKLARQGTKDLKHAFTINDRYRFKRELFGNSDTAFADTLNIISAMDSISEAEEYVYLDLEWDKEIEEVKDFMAIVSLYFSNK